MKKRLVSLLLAAAMLLGMLPTTVFAATVTVDTPTENLQIGDMITLNTNDESQLPTPPDGTVWDGPTRNAICGKEAHEHQVSRWSSCYQDNCDSNSRYHTHCYSDTCTNMSGSHAHCYALICTEEAHSHASACYAYTWTLGSTATASTITFKIVNGTWSGLSLGSDASLSADGTTVTFTATKYDSYGYVYKCGGTMETFLNAILGNDNSLGSAYIIPDEGYTLNGMTSQDWAVENGGLTGSTATANAQMAELKANIHGYDDHMTPTNGFQYGTVYVLTLTKDDYYVTGTIDNGGTVTNASQTLKYQATSSAMVFTPAETYEITGVTVNGSPVSFTTDANGVYTYPAQTIIDDIEVVVTTDLKTYTVTWVDEDGTTVLETDTGVTHGSTPAYNSAEPTKASDAQYHYTFAGWDVTSPDDGNTTVDDPSAMTVTSDMVFRVVYEPANTRTYTVTWVNHNKVTLETDENQPYGAALRYDGATPTKAADALYTYVFKGWDIYDPDDGDNTVDDLSKTTVSGNITLIAVFEPQAIPLTATVEVILNGTVSADGESITDGEHKDISELVTGASNVIYLKRTDGTGSYIALSKTSAGVYSYTGMTNGDYYIYANVNGTYTRIGTQMFIISNADRTRYLPYYSVSYSGGEAPDTVTVPATEYYYIGSEVDVSDAVPVWSGYEFTGWAEGSSTYQPGDGLTTSITEAHALVAQWKKVANVYVNVVIDHYDVSDVSHNNDSAKHNITFTLDQRAKGDNGDYTEILSHTITWIGTGTVPGYDAVSNKDDAQNIDSTEYTANAPTFTSVDANMEYTVTTAKSGYELDTRYGDVSGSGKTGILHETDSSGNIIITVYLVYAPNDFDFTFTVRLDEEDVALNDALKPDYALVKVTSWYDSPYVDGETVSWYTITQHHETYVRVPVDPDGASATATYPVWIGTTTEPATPYYYRIEVVGFEVDGTVYDAAGDGAHTEYATANKVFTAAVNVTGGQDPDSSDTSTLTGAWYGTGAQQGSVEAVVSVKTHTVTFDPEGGVLGGTTENTVLTDKIYAPDTTAYVPTRDGYTFGGWYLDDGNGAYDAEDAAPVAQGTILDKDLYYVAKWNADFDVKGTVVVDLGFPCTDQNRTVKVALQYRNEDGTYFVAHDEVTVSLSSENGKTYATGTYEFLDVPNTGECRIYVIVPAGGTVDYQNEPKSLEKDKLMVKTEYGAEAYMVVDDNGDSVAVVNVYMDATEISLGYMVDASAISADFRPSGINLDMRHDHSDGSYEAIANLPEITGLEADGTAGIYTIAVPPYHANGHLYNYVISTVTYDVAVLSWTDKAHHHYTNDLEQTKAFAPFAVRYTGPANYNETGVTIDGTKYQQDVILKAIFEPNNYTITYVLDGGQWPEGYTPVRQHTWSWDTDLKDPLPVRDGYVFTGWTAAETKSGAEVSIPEDQSGGLYVPASIWKDLTLTANWEKDVIVDPDEPTPDPDKPGDGVADKYQVVINYVAGEGGSVTPTQEVITLRDGDNKLVETLETVNAGGSGAAADVDYVFDGWSDDHSNASYSKASAATGAITIKNVKGGESYTFTASFAEDKKGDPDPQNEDEGDDFADKYQVFIEFHSADANGTVTDTIPESPDNDATGIYQTVTFEPAGTTSGDVTPSLDNVSVTASEGYTFDIWTKDSVARSAVNAPVVPTDTLYNVPGNTTIRFYAHFAGDVLEDPAKDPDHTDPEDEPGDGIPDKYQATVTYVVKNGVWSDGTTADQQVVFTLYEKDAATGAWIHVTPTPTLGDTIPTGMKPDSAHTGEGAWDKPEEVVPTTAVMGNATYTYSFGTAVAPAVDIEKTVKVNGNDKATKAVVGDTVVYTITVENTGSIDLTDLTVTETFGGDISKAVVTLPDGVTEESDGVYRISSLKMGEANMLTITLSYVVTEADAERGILCNSVKVESDDKYDTTPEDPDDPDEPVTDEDKTPDVPVEERKPGLDVEKITTQTSVAAGETIIWEIVIRNTGNVDLTGIKLTDTMVNAAGSAVLYMADGTTPVAADHSFDLAAGVSAVYVAKYVVQTGDVGKTLKNVAAAEVPGGPKDTGTSQDTDIPAPCIPPVDPNPPQLNKQDHIAYIIGYPDGTVQPQGSITRAEVATIFFRLLADESRAYYWSKVNPYTDVNADDWYNNAISTLANADIIEGYPNGAFLPNAPITRAEFAAIAARFSEVIYNDGNSFTDVPENHWAARYIALAEYLGWVNGYPDGTFHPDQAITRAEAMTLINRVLERAVEKEHMLPDMVVWADNLPEAWYYEAVQEATNSHIYVRLKDIVPDQDFCYEDWLEIEPVPDWAALERSWSDANDHR